ncbi:MAG: UvrB/UvrC motif-containing protein, partial [Limisphaerales bacterium]
SQTLNSSSQKTINITPRSVSRAIEESLSKPKDDEKAISVLRDAGKDFDVVETIRELEGEMLQAANNLEFEKAALMRDQIRELKRGSGDGTMAPQSSASYSKGKRRGRGTKRMVGMGKG